LSAKKRILGLLFCMAPFITLAQPRYADSLRNVSQGAKDDSTKVFALVKLSTYYSFLYLDSCLYYAEQVIDFSKKRKYDYGEVLGLLMKSDAVQRLGDFPQALQLVYQALEIAKNLEYHRLYAMGKCYERMGDMYFFTGSNLESIPMTLQAIDLINQSGEDSVLIRYMYFSMAFKYLNAEKADSVLYYWHKGKPFMQLIKTAMRQPTPWLIAGNILNADGQLRKADSFYRVGLAISKEYNNKLVEAVLNFALSSVYTQNNQKDSGIYYLQKSLVLSLQYKFKLFEIETCQALSNIYDSVNADSALKYLKLSLAVKAETVGDSKVREFQQISFQDEKRLRELANTKARYQQQLKMYALLAVLLVFSILAFIFWRTYRQKHRANLLLQNEKEKAESALTELKLTQAQLIQSEKMASLGQLTAGIAHEIQNPLNFVNNFSELNTELIAELTEEALKGNLEQVKTIARDLSENEQRISQHGKRADGIVKGMLLHSRTNSGSREMTDINAIVDEYLRLAYHGLRSKDNSFNATLLTDYDSEAGKINVVPQDIGRVILNLITNAFYAVWKKTGEKLPDYDPVVTVKTKRTTNQVEIIVQDNGSGIPVSIMDKIFQPFFTTKPTGEGTGLGLSLSYDMIKAHQGELKVNSKEGEGSVFTVILPA
jgi:two-component system, NtrC family, sensor kinase